MKPFEIMQEQYQQRDHAAREWKEKGGRVVGYFCDKVPEEMILAAGMFPVRVSGDPRSSMDAANKYTEPFYEGFVRSMFSLLLSGRYDFLDYLVIPHSRDTIVTLYGILLEVKELEPDLKLPEIYLLDTLHTTYFSTDVYNHNRIYDFKKKLAEWSGKAITDKSLSDAINIVNESRKLLARLAALRTAESPRVSGTDALQIIGSSMFMPKEEHNRLLARFLSETGNLPPGGGVRLFVSGSPLDNLQFYQAVESGDAAIVAEDNCWGNRYFDVEVKASGNPIEDIIYRYQNKPPCSWSYPMKLRQEYVLRKVSEAKAEGVIFYVSEYDYGQTWDYPEIKKALEQQGIPTLTFKNQHYTLSEAEIEQIKNSVNEFIKKIKGS